MVTINQINSQIPIEISKGGTNATTMATATGLVKYDGTRLVTSATATLDATNRMTNTAQPAFSAYLAASQANKTGNATVYQLGTDALTEIFDNGGDFNVNGTFTAPVTGKYLLSAVVYINTCTIATYITLSIVTTARTYNITFQRPAGGQNLSQILTVLADMAAGNTAVVQVATGGEAGATNQIVGGAAVQTGFSGYLVC